MNGAGEPPAASSERRRRLLHRAAVPVAAAALLAVQLAAITYFDEPRLLLSTTPATDCDHDTHYEQTLRVTDALERWGRSWAYDPQLLAGFPNGTIFDADNKGWELWTYGLWKLGLPRNLAFNLFVLLGSLLAPWAVYLAARLFRLERAPALVAAGLALAVWYTDGCVHLIAWAGMTAFAMSAYLWLLPLACLFRYLAERRPRHALGLALTLPVVLLIHPYAFAALVVPMTVLYLAAWRRLRAVDHAVVWSAVGLTLAANAWWLLVVLRFWRYALDVGMGGGARLREVLCDYLGLVADRTIGGGLAMRAGFRFLALAAALAALLRWRRARDPRFLPFAVALGALGAVAYLGAYTPLRQIQPYRLIVPAVFLALIPAASFLTRPWPDLRFRSLPRAYRVSLLVLALLVVPRLVRDTLYVCPLPLPDWSAQRVRWPKITDMTGFGSLGFPANPTWVLRGPAAETIRIAQFVRRVDDGQSRFLVENWVLGEYLAGRTHAQVMGGFRVMNLAHSLSNLFRQHPFGPPGEAELRAYFERYAVRWVILSDSRDLYMGFPDLLRLLGDLGPYRVFRTTIAPSLFEENSGTVDASLNRIAVRGTDPARDVVLRYHWLDGFVCTPGCRAEREPVESDPVGFIRVRAPHAADFAVENRY